jgi:hypothetical protein
MLSEDHNKKLNLELSVIELKLKDKLLWGEKLLKTNLELILDSFNPRAPITTPHQDKPSFKKELLIDLLKNQLLFDLHHQELQLWDKLKPLTPQAESIDTECKEDLSNKSNNRLLMKEDIPH